MYKRCKRGQDKCMMRPLSNPLTEAYNVQNLYQCLNCDDYHLCNGSLNCDPLVDREGIVCTVTGKYIQCNVRESPMCGAACLDVDIHPEDNTDCILRALFGDIVDIINKLDDIAEIKDKILAGDSLNEHIKKKIECTFPMCANIINCNSQGYSILCSMFVHIIMSIYANKTIYGHMLFKCTRNKKYDTIAKKIREKWMYLE
ncbi:hypothetical protein [Murine herpesvirus strain 4556]|uniref:31 protein n=2 Tax=Orthoherpesviridae TaxID=3044472 RepID=O41947_MHV68|nr:unknown [Murid gammaherpesvirus 4]AXP99166.1 unknown protein [synthetic construct]QJQ80220.1 hypothetical protein [Murine herpesvirus]UNZ86659.1 hypothetical protein [Murine herpesvirus strain 72]UNZ86736.1 hypothetical protein [Murine herpesvirus strain 4556]AAB66400.1 unknown [Murid gammaherpesvirus 4]